MFWFFVIILALIVEFITMGLFALWFAIGSFVAYILYFMGFSIWIQLVGAIVTVVCSVVLIRPIAVRKFNDKQTQSKIKSLIGMDAIVLTEINTMRGTGLVRINDIEWAAIPKNQKSIYKMGEVVRIVKTGDNYVVVSDK